MNNLCVIPARGGSKRIPKKNIKNFCGLPMIYWSIKVAIETKIFNKVIVSTDSIEIASIAKSFGAEVPFLRPKQLSDDITGTASVVSNVIQTIQEKYNESYTNICCLYATAPLVKKEDIISSYELLVKKKSKSFVFSATSFDFPIQRALKINKDGFSKMLSPEYVLTRSQDLEDYFHDAGQFYWGGKSQWGPDSNIFENGVPFIIPRWRVQDIDTIEDWKRAEIIFKIVREIEDEK